MRNKNIWIFNAGDSFSGNPKWLFMYIVNHHPEIEPWWFCYNRTNLRNMRRLGYHACMFNSPTSKRIGAKAGVYVVNQCKEIIQPYLEGITILNLWHGVGCKTVEKGVFVGFLQERITKKYIRNYNLYRKYQLFLVTSPLMEKHFKSQCGLSDDMLIRAGYPCCIYKENVTTFDHDLLRQKGLPEGTRIAVYAPTYRDNNQNSFFGLAVPDMDRLVSALKENGYLLIFKMHPQMERDFEYQNLHKAYADCPNLLFWDNQNDFYEVMDQIDLAIVDYSSIFYDLLARGVKRFARYIFDYDSDGGALRGFVFDYMEMTCGTVCNNFDELLALFSADDTETDPAELNRIRDLFWAYSGEDDFERIVNRALSFTPDESLALPKLYSFDVFDTLIGRDTLLPAGIFRYVQEKMLETGGFPPYLVERFYKIRPWAEQDCREYYRKSQLSRQTDRIEISFDMIYDRIRELYGISEEQEEQLKRWELEAEYASSIPYPDMVERVKELKAQGETVVLISDMYLPLDFVKKLLMKADPELAELPLYLSSEYGVQKTTKKLYMQAFMGLGVDYEFDEWLHCGDNPKADGSTARQLGISTERHVIPSPDHYEKEINNFIGTYDGYRVSALFSRFRAEGHTSAEVFAYCYVSLYFVPYVDWVVNDAVKRGLRHLCFISRDGHFLKIIADGIIKARGLDIKTSYIYGSRRAWRVPSQVDGIDDDFFSEYGNFVGIKNYTELLSAADISDDDFSAMFPELAFLKEGEITGAMLKQVREMLGGSEKYRSYLMERARAERPVILEYLRQEIDLDEPHAFVEYWGRGYTQTCLARLIWEAAGRRQDVPFYYSRSIYPSEEYLPRYNFAANTYSYIFIEAIFANLPYQTVREYRRETEEEAAKTAGKVTVASGAENVVAGAETLENGNAVAAAAMTEDAAGKETTGTTLEAAGKVTAEPGAASGRIVPVLTDNPYCNHELYEAMNTYLPRFTADFCAISAVDEDRLCRDLFDLSLSYFHRFETKKVFIDNLAVLADEPSVFGQPAAYAPPITIGGILRHFTGHPFPTKSKKMSLAVSAPIYRKAYRFYTKYVLGGVHRRRLVNRVKKLLKGARK